MHYADHSMNEAIGCHWRSELEALCFKKWRLVLGCIVCVRNSKQQCCLAIASLE